MFSRSFLSQLPQRLSAVRRLAVTNAVPSRAMHSSRVVASDKLSMHRNSPQNNTNMTFEFTPENMKTAKAILAKYPDNYKKAAIIPLLDLGQRQHGFTSLAVMNHIAKLVDVPPMRVYEVASFYTMFNRDPVGKYFVQVCTTTPCMLCDSTGIVKTIEKHLGIKVGETTSDGMFTLVEVECAGACVNAPVIAVNDDYFEDLTPETTIAVLDAIKAGQKPNIGPQRKDRQTCEPVGGLTSLTTPIPDGGYKVRPDL